MAQILADTALPKLVDYRRHAGPFDIIGDVHGCFDELLELTLQLGYSYKQGTGWRHHDDRALVLVGDLVNRGTGIAQTIHSVLQTHKRGRALCVLGNHDAALARAVRTGKDGGPSIATSLDQCRRDDPALLERFEVFERSLPPYMVLDGGRLVVAHAGLPEAMQGRIDGEAREFALVGLDTGVRDSVGRPVRWDWAAEYQGEPLVVYGHTPQPAPRRVGRTINVDTGCVYGGALSAYRYPEDRIVTVPANRQYWAGKAAVPPPDAP